MLPVILIHIRVHYFDDLRVCSNKHISQQESLKIIWRFVLQPKKLNQLKLTHPSVYIVVYILGLQCAPRACFRTFD